MRGETETRWVRPGKARRTLQYCKHGKGKTSELGLNMGLGLRNISITMLFTKCSTISIMHSMCVLILTEKYFFSVKISMVSYGMLVCGERSGDK